MDVGVPWPGSGTERAAEASAAGRLRRRFPPVSPAPTSPARAALRPGAPPRLPVSAQAARCRRAAADALKSAGAFPEITGRMPRHGPPASHVCLR